ncbi:MAG: sodium:solute symporter family protein [Deltaproteobacteria bacterium]|nr:sodium:solute symporter family protein [Deltaproteobacteria bacterium]
MEVAYGQPVDYVVLGLYFLAILGFGSFFARYTRTTREFFQSGQRFAWWILSLSALSVVVGSYSFVKYSAVGFRFGLSSTQAYLNDWFLVPLFALGWLPIVYYARVGSIPEYFERRFDRPTRLLGVLFILVYLVGYIGINLYTMGVALEAVIPSLTVFQWAVVVAVITSVYCASGGQAAVIMTDLIQAVLLLLAGFVVLLLGVAWLGAHNGLGLPGWEAFWSGLPLAHRLPFSGFAEPAEFPMAGVFWQDLFGSSMFLYFANQGMIMRFQAARSVHDARKAMFTTCLVLMPLAAVAVSSGGWIGRAMETWGLLPAGTDANRVFMAVTEMIALPGVFGFILAALVAALMSSIDALINAVAAIGINDLYRPFLVRNRSDRHYLRVARLLSLGFTSVGLALVPLFMAQESIYVAHATFTAAISPPLILVVVLGILWKRFSARAAVATLVAGAAIMAASFVVPDLVTPFARLHGMHDPDSVDYMRALYGFLVCGVVALLAALLWPLKDASRIEGYWVGTLAAARRAFKGGEPNDAAPGRRIRLRLVLAPEDPEVPDHADDLFPVRLAREDADRLAAREGDILYVAEDRWWLGGLRSVHGRLAVGDVEPGTVEAGARALAHGFLVAGRIMVVDKQM